MICFRISAVSTNVAIIPNTSLHNPVVIPLKFLHIFCAKRTGHCQAFLWDSCWILGILMPSFQNPSFCYGFASLASETEDFKSLHMFLICTIFWDVKIFMGFSSPSAETCKNHIITYGFDMRHGGSYLLILSGLDIFWYFQALIFFDIFWYFQVFGTPLKKFAIFFDMQGLPTFFDTWDFWYVLIRVCAPSAAKRKRIKKTNQNISISFFWYVLIRNCVLLRRESIFPKNESKRIKNFLIRILGIFLAKLRVCLFARMLNQSI